MQMHTKKIMNLNVWIMLNMSGLHIGFEKDEKNLIFVLIFHATEPAQYELIEKLFKITYFSYGRLEYLLT